MLDVLGVRVAHGDGAIAILLLHHKLRHRLAHDVAATEHYALLAGCLNAVTLEQRHDAKRCGRDEARQSDGHATHVDWMKSVNILAIVDGFNYLLLVDVARQRQLHDKSVYVGIAVEFVDTSQQLFLGDIILISDECRLEATLLTSQNLVLDVCLRTSVMAYENGSQMRLIASFSHYGLHFFCYFSLDGFGSCFSVYQLHIVMF